MNVFELRLSVSLLLVETLFFHGLATQHFRRKAPTKLLSFFYEVRKLFVCTFTFANARPYHIDLPGYRAIVAINGVCGDWLPGGWLPGVVNGGGYKWVTGLIVTGQ
ncbi:hypothetical protein VOLCADRAFT_97904 [Volvox carteri f. nagariensis]|uniref:Secreted protein n=1 Tax=Volvox carteri f. nagariensis TaxID=3068 RepID=D8UDY4_VOLCA|nr:uncharacterized protein VOLCADRAFT_97904 [Volvox carteri f. nagariensis]EFJ41994.1 hypothetical protein VOLCADRAFT_97904 [Volvox carteri f. nagariensis]|eukprot:XP_002956869.1 hypothetical protein VOLCADRAFT_97904 [Volvox carteri f. nagariensis]